MSSNFQLSQPTQQTQLKVVATIPCWNEERFIRDVVSKARKYVDQVIVVNDGSHDSTAEAAKAAGALVMSHQKNLGKGAAMKTAGQSTDADILIFLDGDGAHNPQDIPKLIRPILEGKADLVIGSRALPESKVSISPLTRRLSNNLASEENVTEDTPLHTEKVNHIYVASEVAAELYCYSYQKLYGQDFTILRYGIPYGPRARGGTVLATFVTKALNHEPLTIFGDGNQYRNFIYVEDLAEGNVAALNEIAKNKAYNLEGLRPITVREMAQIVRKLVGGVEIKYKEARPGDLCGKSVSREKAENELGWKPKVDFEEGLKRYIEWYRESVLYSKKF